MSRAWDLRGKGKTVANKSSLPRAFVFAGIGLWPIAEVAHSAAGNFLGHGTAVRHDMGHRHKRDRCGQGPLDRIKGPWLKLRNRRQLAY